MTIQRQYSLPYCKLVLEGFGDDSSAGGASNGRPVLANLMNVECHFVGHEQSLTGGREFLENLLNATSHYAQSVLSGIPHPTGGESQPVQWQRLAADQHRLTIQLKPDQANGGSTPESLQLDLQTLQFFDLVEALDQLCADAQTLPDLTPNLTAVPRRETKAQEPVSKRVVPAAVGLSGLAVAAIAFFYIPAPEVRPPEPEPTNQESPESPDGLDSPSPEPTAPPPPDADTSPETSEPSPAPEESPAADPTPASETGDAGSVEQAEAELESLLASAPLITDVEQIDALTGDVRRAISDAWEREHTFGEDAMFRVGVAENGDILGFRPANQVAIEGVDETPMLELLYLPVGEELRQDEPMVEMKVVFTPDGVVEVSPWHGWPDEQQ
jgi:hypothetical protein